MMFKKVMPIMLLLAFIAVSSEFLMTMERFEKQNSRIFEVMYGSSGVSFIPKTNFSSIELYVSGPDGAVIKKKFASGTPYIGLADFKNSDCPDGRYNYELRVQPSRSGLRERSGDEAGGARETFRGLIQDGTFYVVNGSIVVPNGSNEFARANDVLHNDDVIVIGSLCAGTDCTQDMDFDHDVLVLKENNIRLFFDDTSNTPFPLTDWRISINDTESGGASYFAVSDATNNDTPFKIEANAPTNSLYIEDYGRIGIGTSVPSVEVHVLNGDSPALRLDQDTSSGWTAQTWDLAGNESNFFVRDVTNSSKIPFRIQPNTPSNTLTLKSDGKVGIGTWSPTFTLELEATGSNPSLGIQRTDGVSAQFLVSTTQFQFGSVSNHPIKFLINNVTAMTLSTGKYLGIGINPIYPLHLSNGAYCTVGGVWTNASSISLKENIQPLTRNEAFDALTRLKPVKYNYKTDKDEQYVGFIAEEAPELVATNDKTGMSPMDVAAVLTKVVQQQQEMIARLEEKVAQLEKQISETSR